MTRVLQSSSEQTTALTELIKHQTNLLSAKDPLAYQAIATPSVFEYDTPDPSDDAEIQRLRERGLSDGAILDEWSGSDPDIAAEIAAARSELLGEGRTYE